MLYGCYIEKVLLLLWLMSLLPLQLMLHRVCDERCSFLITVLRPTHQTDDTTCVWTCWSSLICRIIVNIFSLFCIITSISLTSVSLFFYTFDAKCIVHKIPMCGQQPVLKEHFTHKWNSVMIYWNVKWSFLCLEHTSCGCLFFGVY